VLFYFFSNNLTRNESITKPCITPSPKPVDLTQAIIGGVKPVKEENLEQAIKPSTQADTEVKSKEKISEAGVKEEVKDSSSNPVDKTDKKKEEGEKITTETTFARKEDIKEVDKTDKKKEEEERRRRKNHYRNQIRKQGKKRRTSEIRR